jgi:hypothetical protein
MSKSKWPQVQEKLMLIEKWARDGLTEEQMCLNLGVSVNALNIYKKRYPELKESLKKGKEIIITEIENALIKRALGYDVEEVKTSIRMIDGKETKYTEKSRKHIPPDVGACAILLKNKDRGNWSDNPMKLEIERELLELRKKIEEDKMF